MHERGYQLGNVDITIIAQQPKLSPHKEKMRDQLCLLLGSHPSTVNIKASAYVMLWLLAANSQHKHTLQCANAQEAYCNAWECLALISFKMLAGKDSRES